ncbi:hypothetical protein DCF75_08815 [Edwardsiella tarda]|nr:hypothetical protein DCF75_08815 [Edwardsiella tarda]
MGRCSKEYRRVCGNTFAKRCIICWQRKL